MDIVERRLRITGSNAFRDELDSAIELLAAEPSRYEPIVTDAVALSELPEVARRQLERPDAVKVVVSAVSDYTGMSVTRDGDAYRTSRESREARVEVALDFGAQRDPTARDLAWPSSTTCSRCSAGTPTPSSTRPTR